MEKLKADPFKGSIELTEKQQKIYKNLENQINKIAKHNRIGSFKTKERYLEATKTFCKFLARDFATQKFNNISSKHIEAYVMDMQKRGLSASTIKSNLSAIRFYHDKLDSPRYKLAENSDLGVQLEKRQFLGHDRAWTDKEYKTFQNICANLDNKRVYCIAMLAHNEGLRLHECLRIDRNDVEKALKTGALHTKGKGGKERDVPLSQTSRTMLEEQIKDVQRGHKVFVEDGEQTHLVIKQVQNFINFHRDKFQENLDGIGRTFHGLRHAFAREQYLQRIAEGKAELQARLEVSKLLGHERDEVTKIYLT